MRKEIIGNSELFLADCLDVFKKLKDESVDLIVTDPPYLMDYKTGYRKDKGHDFCSAIQNDSNDDLVSQSIKEMHRVLKDGSGAYIFCNSNKIDFFKAEAEKYFDVKNILIWIKNNWTAGDLAGAYAKRTEFIIFAAKGRHELSGGRDTDCLFYDRVSGDDQVHQNQKPLSLIKYLILKSSKENDVVLDAFMGSGTTGVACQSLNRKFIGCEVEEKYFEVACKRIDRESKNINLFGFDEVG